MARIVTVVLILAAVALAFGIFVPAIYRAREEEEMLRCQNNLRQIGSFGLFHSSLPGQPAPAEANSFFPSGTLVNKDLVADRRMSWYVLILGAVEEGPGPAPAPKSKKDLPYAAMLAKLKVDKPWDDEAQRALAYSRLAFALCPAQMPDSHGGPALTNYVGNGGIGRQTPELSVADAGKNAGVFRYDTPTPLSSVRDGDGLSNCISVGETARDVRPWLQGGPATVRTVEPADAPYLGTGRIYAGCHRNRGNFAFADGSVRVLTDQTTPAVFHALLTIQGSEKDDDFEGD